MLNQLNTTTKRELDTRYLVNSDILQGSKEVTNTSGRFSIPDYGITENIEMYFKPTQDLHGYDKPWAGGAGKNLLPMTVDGIKAANTTGTWSGDTYTLYGVTFTLQTNDGKNITNIKVEGSPSSRAELTITNTGSYIKNTYKGMILNGATGVTGGNNGLYIAYSNDGETWAGEQLQTNTDITLLDYDYFYVRIMCSSGTFDTIFQPMIRLATETDPTFEPYSNICPITGQDNASLTWDTNQGISMNFGTTYYGGIANFDGTINSDWQRIASYNGETLSGEWLSDRDEYVAGTTPTRGAEVVYKTKPKTIRVTPPDNINLTDDYPIEYNGYKATIKYQPKDTILEDAKSYTNQQIKKLGLPQAPTSNGTYNLVCTVSSGVPTLSWESTT